MSNRAEARVSDRSMRMRLTVAAVLAIAAAVIAYFVTRGHADAPAAPAAPTANAPAKAAPPPAPDDAARAAKTPPPGSHLRFLADDAARMRVMTAIAAARARRTGTPAPTTADPTPPPKLDGSMSKEDIQSSFKEVVPLLVECYEQALPRLKTKDGTVKVHMRATGEPEVGTLIETADLDTDGAFLDDKDLGECLHETLMSVELPPMPEGGVVEITYPLVFQQTGD